MQPDGAGGKTIMKAHEYASIFPMLPDAELKQLAADIKLNGLNNPIITLDGMILDGRNRYAACKIAGLRPRFDEYQGDDPLAYVFSQNFTRRQLSESQKGMIGARYATLEHGGDRSKASRDVLKTVGQSITDAAERVGVGASTIDRAKRVIRDGVPELVAAVESGEVSVKAAANVAKLPHDEQREAIAAGTEAIKAAANSTPAPTLVQEETPAKTRRAPMDLAIGNELAGQAIIVLNRILKMDKQRVEALTRIRDYCDTRLANNK